MPCTCSPAGTPSAPQACAPLTASVTQPPAGPPHPPALHTDAAGRAPTWAAAAAKTCRQQRRDLQEGPSIWLAPTSAGAAVVFDADRKKPLLTMSSVSRASNSRGSMQDGCLMWPRCLLPAYRASSRDRASAMRWFSSLASTECLGSVRTQGRRHRGSGWHVEPHGAMQSAWCRCGVF